MTQDAGGGEVTVRRGGIRASMKRVVEHASSLVRLQKELARAELERKGSSVGAGAALGLAAGVLALYAGGFGLAAAAVALSLVVEWWLALGIVFAALVLLVIVLLLVSRSLFRRGAPLAPEQAIEEARLTRRVLRGNRAG